MIAYKHAFTNLYMGMYASFLKRELALGHSFTDPNLRFETLTQNLHSFENFGFLCSSAFCTQILKEKLNK